MTAPATFTPLPPLSELAAALASGTLTSRALVETALERVSAPQGQGRTVFVELDASAARAAADASDALRRGGTVLSPLMGIPISIKDLFDVAGQVTRAGSRVLAGRTPATHDAAAVAALRAAGAIMLGRTNMTEFAFSGLGLNPHYGTPLSPYRRDERRIAGGSSSGAAASVADGMAAAALGSDTGGSVRIPAALCGMTGFKPTAARVSTAGAWALSPSLDSVGPIARTVDCCITLDAVLTGNVRLSTQARAVRPVRALRLAVLRNVALEGLDPEVASAFDAALRSLADAGATLEDISLPALDRLAQINRFGFSVIESYQRYRDLVETRPAEFDPRVLERLRRGAAASAADYETLRAERESVIAATSASLHDFDALLMPTTALIAPCLAELEDDDDHYRRTNALMLRNPSMINFIDGCAITMPCHAPGAAPVGLTLAASGGRDETLLSAALAVESTLARVR